MISVVVVAAAASVGDQTSPTAMKRMNAAEVSAVVAVAVEAAQMKTTPSPWATTTIDRADVSARTTAGVPLLHPLVPAIGPPSHRPVASSKTWWSPRAAISLLLVAQAAATPDLQQTPLVGMLMKLVNRTLRLHQATMECELVFRSTLTADYRD